MNKIDKLIQIVHNLKEEGAIIGGMTTGSSGPIAGFSEKSPAPTAGITPKLGPIRRRYAYLGPKSRNRWKQPQ